MAQNLWDVPPELTERYLGWFGWKARLSDKDRYRLAFTRSLMTPEHEEDFALAFADMMESAEYNDGLEETCGNPKARAVVRPEAELDSFPFLSLPG